MLILLNLAVIAALACLVYFQTNRSIFIRSVGLLVILAAELMFSFQVSSSPNPGFLVGMGILCLLGFASDYYMATLRTWSFRTSEQAIWGAFIGGFIGGYFASLFFGTLIAFMVFSLIGAVIGESRANGFRSFTHMSKSAVGTFVGVFGLSTKLLLGIEMAYWFVYLQMTSLATSPKVLHTLSMM